MPRPENWQGAPALGPWPSKTRILMKTKTCLIHVVSYVLALFVAENMTLMPNVISRRFHLKSCISTSIRFLKLKCHFVYDPYWNPPTQVRPWGVWKISLASLIPPERGYYKSVKTQMPKITPWKIFCGDSKSAFWKKSYRFETELKFKGANRYFFNHTCGLSRRWGLLIGCCHIHIYIYDTKLWCNLDFFKTH